LCSPVKGYYVLTGVVESIKPRHYLGKKLSEKLSEADIDLVTTVRKNMIARPMLSKRYIIETINYQLKNISQVEHSRYRSETGFMLNVISGIVVYCLKKKKPRIKLSASEFGLMAA
jgi:hypothetical protein